ncbi:MAG: hypothetical protein E7Z92_01875 [Cyanobacteria bacterium SIG31]|nr:hypothetical protein [Cyanobacteria bacterium SIG31]
MGKKSEKTTNKTVYGNTTTTNPYVTSQTTNKGTVSAFNPGTAYDTINNFVNANTEKLLDEYLNPTLNSVTNQSKMNSFMNNLNAQTSQNLENNIINPLSNRNMVRSSQATNMYNNLAQTNASQIAEYANNLLANSQSDTAKMLTNLLLWYMNGYNVLSDTQNQSLVTSQGNATNTQNKTSSGIDSSQMLQLAMQLALQSAGV